MHSAAPVKDSFPPPAEFAARCEAAARGQGFRVERFGEAAGVPLLAFSRRTPGVKPRIYLSAGIHGDEPAPPLALLDWLERGWFDDRAVWLLCPMLNPAGLARGTRHNAEDVDLNRDFKSPRSTEIRAHVAWLQRQPSPDLAICLHEDWEATGFYLYELNALGLPSPARAMLEAVSPICPIEPAIIIDGRPTDEPGIIRPIADPLLRDTWPESIFLRHHHARLGYTIESPSARPLAQRIAALQAAVATAVAATVQRGSA
ncbi:MAG: M14 family metallocarboxypeptidase [Opitutaceae bacterium]|nr:M14 family metallocarboxypeptidase [Opitutaceae bacterium]